MTPAYVGRNPAASPATGYHHEFVREQEEIVGKITGK